MVGERGEMDACMHGLLFSLLSERQSPPSCAHHSVLVLTTRGSHGGPVNRDDAAEFVHVPHRQHPRGGVPVHLFMYLPTVHHD